MNDASSEEKVEILSELELGRTLDRLASQILETVSNTNALLLIGIPTRGVHLSQVLASKLEVKTGHQIAHGSLDPTFHRDDLGRIGTRMVQPTDLPTSVEGKEVLLVDDVIFN